MTTSSRGQPGFTLVEMLVVLLVAGMALALATQAIGQYQRVHQRASANERTSREYRMAEAWLRASIRGLHAVPEPTFEDIRQGLGSRAAVFTGKSGGYTGVTLSPVLAGQGIPTVQEWSVVAGPGGTDALELTEQERTLLLPFPGEGTLRFHYFDSEGGVHDQWPPAQGIWPQLPAAIALEISTDWTGTPATVVVEGVLGPRIPLDLPYEEEPI